MILEALAEPFEPVEAEAARAALAEHWGIRATGLSRLETERDDTFRADTAAGILTLKIAHPADAPALIQMQSAAIEHARAADPGLPLQHVLPTTDGSLSAPIAGRTARVLTWLDGDLMLNQPRTEAQLAHVGTLLGRLSRALADFTHPGADRELAWDLPRLPQLRAHTDDPFVLDVIDGYTADTVPRLAVLPHQVIHNDMHPGNVLVDARDPDRVTGILDFGDALRTARVCDLGVAIAYLLPDADPVWPSVQGLIAAFDAEVPLLDEERALLPSLVIARLVMRNLIGAAMNDAAPELDRFYARNLRSIHRILKET